MADQLPWKYHTDLTRERLMKVAALIVAGRNAALERFSPSVGSNGWTLGCEAFQFGRFRISAAAGSDGYEWLFIVDPSMQFVFKIGEVPVRFYKGAPDEPSERTLRQSFSELKQLSLSFPKVSKGSELAYRFAVETDFEGEVINIAFVGLHGEIPVLVWNVPLDESRGTLVTIPQSLPEGDDLPKPTVRVPGADKESAEK